MTNVCQKQAARKFVEYITKYIDESGDVVAAYEYDAFGKTVSQTGSLADVFRHRFSTKYFDSETGLYYYGYRFYSPTLMRWLNRDPIEEDGGLNLYGFCGNAALATIDPSGKKVELINHLIGTIPPGGWSNPDVAAETVFAQQRQNTEEWCVFNGKLRFSVEIVPEVLVVHIYYRQLKASNFIRTNMAMSVARLREQDHVAIARKIDNAFHLYKHQVERINAVPGEARHQKVLYENVLHRTIRRLMDENQALDRKGGPHDLFF